MLDRTDRRAARAVAAALACAATGAHAAGDTIFADGFESPIALDAYVVAASGTCAGGGPLRQGDLAQLCYRFFNESADLAFTHQRVADDAFGVTYDHDLALAPGTDATVPADLAPFPIEEVDYHLATWTASGPARTATTTGLVLFSYDPYVRLSALLVGSAADCVQGEADNAPYVSGLTAVTVAPGTPLAGCYRAQNLGTTRLDHDRLVDDTLGTLLDDATTAFGQGGVYSVPRSADTAATSMLSATWHAGFGADDATYSSAAATITVVADPACHGVATGSLIDYSGYFTADGSPGNSFPAGMRLGLDARATPVRGGAAFTIRAHGVLATAASLFGPRSDTRIVLRLPAGIDLSRALTVQATLGSGAPLTQVVDVAARTLTLRTGPMAGPPGDADIVIDAYADGGTDALAFSAPSIELDMQIQGIPATLVIVPEPNAPAMLVTPRCTMQAVVEGPLERSKPPAKTWSAASTRSLTAANSRPAAAPAGRRENGSLAVPARQSAPRASSATAVCAVTETTATPPLPKPAAGAPAASSSTTAMSR